MLEIVEEPANEHTLAEYAGIPISFTVESRLRIDVVEGGFGGFSLVPETVSPSYTKDYDLDPVYKPTNWGNTWDLTHWSLLIARDEGVLVGGATVVHDAPDVWFSDGRKDVAVLWDLRVRPDARRGGVGKALFDGAIAWARARQCRYLKVETQNVNVNACRFYAAMGCELGVINRFAYAGTPEEAEVQLVWYYRLS